MKFKRTYLVLANVMLSINELIDKGFIDGPIFGIDERLAEQARKIKPTISETKLAIDAIQYKFGIDYSKTLGDERYN